MAKLLLPNVFTKVEKLASKLPERLREPVLNHFHAMEDLFAHGQLEAARRSDAREVKLEAARKLIGTASAVCTTIGVEPIPLADFPLITGVQLLTVGGIIYISGREVSTKAAAEFLGALGTNLGAGLVLREGARALAKLLPGFGNAISGAIAGAGTYAIGKAASAYFIEGVSIKDARQLFRRSRKTAPKRMPRALPPSSSSR
jgi:uncharacterized protein (DUF697 family)